VCLGGHIRRGVLKKIRALGEKAKSLGLEKGQAEGGGNGHFSRKDPIRLTSMQGDGTENSSQTGGTTREGKGNSFSF